MLVSTCCGVAGDEDTGICLRCKEHCGFEHDNDYDYYEAMAEDKGWNLPANDVFSKETWVTYWMAMEQYQEMPEMGRPIPPHRSA